MGVTGTYSVGVPRISFFLRRADGTVLAERDADEVFYAASTVKIAVLAAVARALDAGTLTLDTSVLSARTFASDAPGAPDYDIHAEDIDEGLPPPGSPMPLAEVVERMIVVSSNEATNMASQLVGLDAIRDVLRDGGTLATTYDAKYSDFAAVELGAQRTTTARDLTALMSAIITGALASPERTAWMTGVLTRQHDRLLTASAPDGSVFGSKSGSVDGIRHDVAYFGPPGPDTVVMAVCTRDFDEPAAEEAIRALGHLALGSLARR